MHHIAFTTMFVSHCHNITCIQTYLFLGKGLASMFIGSIKFHEHRIHSLQCNKKNKHVKLYCNFRFHVLLNSINLAIHLKLQHQGMWPMAMGVNDARKPNMQNQVNVGASTFMIMILIRTW